MSDRIRFETDPSRYRHWRLAVEGPVATLTLAVDPAGGLGDYELKLNSYDLGVDIELHDALQRLRFEHPGVKAVVVTGGLDKVFCAGANIGMLAGASHAHKVGFCKFTNETRNGMEEMSARGGQVVIAAVNGTAAGGGYELALACEEILLVDDRSSSVSLPEVPLLAVLPGTGGLTRVVDKRHVRRDLADVFATKAEGVRGRQAVEWGLVDAVAPPSGFAELVRSRAEARAAASDRPDGGDGVVLGPLEPRFVSVDIDRDLGVAHLTVRAFGSLAEALDACRELDAAVLDLRFNEPEVGTWVLHTEGDATALLAADEEVGADGWLPREVRLFWGRTLKRLDVSARTLVALIEPGSCFAGTLAELALAADRTLMLDDGDTSLLLTAANDGRYPMANGLSRLATRFWGRDDDLARARATLGKALVAADAAEAGLVTATPDDLDWDDEVRLLLEERASFSPDALTGMEANLRFPGPETLETKIFARLTAWQNWIFQRPNAVGPEGALRRYGTGARPAYDKGRV
ncbi:MAG TPA: 2,3-epoxybenzoyl-CoA dihydrolase [Acidimicrobiales bacterium]